MYNSEIITSNRFLRLQDLNKLLNYMVEVFYALNLSTFELQIAIPSQYYTLAVILVKKLLVLST